MMVTPTSIDTRTASRLSSLSRVIGNTPLLGIEYRYRGQKRIIFAKCEQMNLTGSIKDRMALHILRRAYAEGSIKPGDIASYGAQIELVSKELFPPAPVRKRRERRSA